MAAMLLGQILFVLAALVIVGATAAGLVYGLGTLVVFKALGRDLGPLAEPGSSDWGVQAGATVDLSRESLLTERRGRTTKDPVVNLAGVRFRVTRLEASRFLVTRADDANRVGTFELDGDGPEQTVVPEPDDPADAMLVTRVAVLASLVRLGAAA
jgi:hypothetical protein